MQSEGDSAECCNAGFDRSETARIRHSKISAKYAIKQAFSATWNVACHFSTQRLVKQQCIYMRRTGQNKRSKCYREKLVHKILKF